MFVAACGFGLDLGEVVGQDRRLQRLLRLRRATRVRVRRVRPAPSACCPGRASPPIADSRGSLAQRGRIPPPPAHVAQEGGQGGGIRRRAGVEHVPGRVAPDIGAHGKRVLGRGCRRAPAARRRSCSPARSRRLRAVPAPHRAPAPYRTATPRLPGTARSRPGLWGAGRARPRPRFRGAGGGGGRRALLPTEASASPLPEAVPRWPACRWSPARSPRRRWEDAPSPDGRRSHRVSTTPNSRPAMKGECHVADSVSDAAAHSVGGRRRTHCIDGSARVTPALSAGTAPPAPASV